MIEIRPITRENPEDLNLKNEPFTMPGRFIPALSTACGATVRSFLKSLRVWCFPTKTMT